MDSSLRQPFNSLICAACSHSPSHFHLLLHRCFNTLTSTPSPLLPPTLPGLLSTTSQAAHSELCSPLILSSPLLTSVLAELTDSLSQLISHAAPTASVKSHSLSSSSTLLPRVCGLLAFLTDLARDWYPAKVWLGGAGRRNFWPRLLKFLSLAELHHTLPVN